MAGRREGRFGVPSAILGVVVRLGGFRPFAASQGEYLAGKIASVGSVLDCRQEDSRRRQIIYCIPS